MKRDIVQTLLKWKNRDPHLPLIIEGARQIGKSYTIEEFGRQHFQSLTVINFERSPEFKTCFQSMDPNKILMELELLTRQNIEPSKTLLFLDEIQECPNAIKALRYFKEELPALHIIGAGSLLAFTLAEAEFSMPVGRIQFLHLHPLSFREFLSALDENKAISYLEKISLDEPIPEAIHQKLLEQARLYFLLGGMPAVIQTYLETKSITRAREIQIAILQTYRADFGKYARKNEFPSLDLLFAKLPLVMTQVLKYSKLNPDLPARSVKDSLEKLHLAGLMNPVFHSNASGLPLSATMNEKKFKALFLDLGLALRACKVEPQPLIQEDTLFLLQGAMMEQFVGQELLAYENPYETPSLFFWSREAKSSQAEVDYVMTFENEIIPIEVKSTSLGHLKSLHRFMEEKKSLLGIRISEKPFSFQANILSVPLYAVFELQTYVSTQLSKIKLMNP